MILTQKETMLLNDMMTQEQTCVDKYNFYAEKASDPQLKSLFTSLAQKEQQHYDTLNQMSKGTVPQMQAGGAQQSKPQFQPKTQGAQMPNQGDAFLCQDLLSTEKHVSSAYNTAIFEFRDAGMRNALNHIQKEEQEHGKQLYDYMAQHGAY